MVDFTTVQDKAMVEGHVTLSKARINGALRKSIEQAWKIATTSKHGEPLWNFYPYIGSWAVSMYLVGLKLLDEGKHTLLQHERKFADILIQTQLPDGSWDAVKDAAVEEGPLDGTMWNHWFLTLVSEPSRSEARQQALDRSAKFIRSKGGLEKMNGMTKIWLAIGGHYPWSRIAPIPLFIFRPESYFYAEDLTAQWIYPHLLPIAFLSHTNTIFRCGPSLDYLWIQKPNSNEMIPRCKKLSDDTDQIFREILRIWNLHEINDPYLKQQQGSVGAYTPSTLFAVVAVHAHKKLVPDHPLNSQLLKASETALDYLEACLVSNDNTIAPYMGATMDGSTWDSLLVALALAIADGPSIKIDKAIQRLCRENVDQNGGVGYGYGFLQYPDTDDTSVFVTLLSTVSKRNKNEEHSTQIRQSLKWVIDHQNRDGGFPAFDSNKEGKNPFWQFVFWCTGLVNAAEFFDPSCADITGHFLEAAGCCGLNVSNSVAVQMAIEYLQREQLACGAWQGRWGVNYIYALGAVLPGLAAVGYPLGEYWVGRAVEWLVNTQNGDGGFGETAKSYLDPRYAGKGVSTVTQTSWACLALIAVQDEYDVDQVLQTAIEFLLERVEQSKGIPKDESVVGTGHRHCVYMQYPAYPLAFPMIALKRYEEGMYQVPSKSRVQVADISKESVKVGMKAGYALMLLHFVLFVVLAVFLL